MTFPKETPRVRYEINVCGGGFDSVRSRFRVWKRESLIYWPERRMFEGKSEVRPLGGTTFDNTEVARHTLQRTCSPRDEYALAAFVQEDGRDLWLVMAAYDAQCVA